MWDDKATIIRNQEYILVHDNESNIENNSAIIVNYRGSIFTGIYGLRNKKVNVVEVNNNIQGQVDYLSDKYDNIYISQGTLACFRDDSNEFFHDQIIKNFKYEIIYYDPKVLIDSGKTCPIFLYKLIF